MSYLDVARLHNPDKNDLQIEQAFAQMPGVQRKTGKSNTFHRLQAMKLLWPKREHLSWYTQKVESIQEAREHEIQEIGWSGCANSMKTSSLADIPLQMYWEAPEVSTIYIASPYKDATRQNLWARLMEQFNTAKERWPHLTGRLIPSQGRLVHSDSDKHPLSFIHIISADEVAKLVGKKAIDPARGILMVVIDESPELRNDGQEMISVLSNLQTVDRFLLVYSGNFARTDDFMGRMAEPPAGYESIRGQVDTLKRYRTKRGGILLRFDGHDSENVKAGKDFTDAVLKNKHIERELERNGGSTASPGYMRYIRSWPVLDISEFRVTNPGKIECGFALLEAKFTSQALLLISFCDPGFGGDPAVIQDLRVGYEMRDGRQQRVIELDGPPVVIPIDLERRDAAGKIMTPEQQIVAYHKAHCQRKGIPPRQVGFDGSLRAGIVQQYGRDWSVEVQAVSPEGQATERPTDARSGRTCREEYANFVTEQWYSMGLLIQCGQLRGLQYSPAAKDQLCKRPWFWSGKKKQILPKSEFKKQNSGKSPDEADALCGGLEIARQRGFVIEGLTASGGSVMDMLKAIQERNRVQSYRQLAQGGQNASLPPGRLQRTSGETDFRGGRLKQV